MPARRLPISASTPKTRAGTSVAALTALAGLTPAAAVLRTTSSSVDVPPTRALLEVKPCQAFPDHHGRVTEVVVAVGQPGCSHGICHEGDVVGAGQIEHHPDGLRVEVDAVADEFDDDLTCRRQPQAGRDRTGAAVMKWRHTIEQVCDGRPGSC